jgi:hypothetical protein
VPSPSHRRSAALFLLLAAAASACGGPDDDAASPSSNQAPIAAPAQAEIAVFGGQPVWTGIVTGYVGDELQLQRDVEGPVAVDLAHIGPLGSCADEGGYLQALQARVPVGARITVTRALGLDRDLTDDGYVRVLEPQAFAGDTTVNQLLIRDEVAAPDPFVTLDDTLTAQVAAAQTQLAPSDFSYWETFVHEYKKHPGNTSSPGCKGVTTNSAVEHPDQVNDGDDDGDDGDAHLHAGSAGSSATEPTSAQSLTPAPYLPPSPPTSATDPAHEAWLAEAEAYNQELMSWLYGADNVIGTPDDMQGLDPEETPERRAKTQEWSDAFNRWFSGPDGTTGTSDDMTGPPLPEAPVWYGSGGGGRSCDGDGDGVCNE